MNTFNFLTTPIADALGWTLLHAVWQGFALVLPDAVILHFLRHRSGVIRYRVGVFTLLAQVLASAGTFFWYYQPVSVAQPLAPAITARYASPIQWQTVAQSIPWHQQTQQFLENHLSQFVLIYLIGVALFGLRLVGGWLYLQQLSKTATLPVSQHWLHLANQLRSTLAIRAVVQVRESARIAMPMVVGVLKPVLLLPIGLATHLSTREIEAVLAHELAHIKRHDYAVNLLQSVVEVLYFFHPALWWLSARVREEREHCCDDLAVQACGGDGRILAQALAHVEELRVIQSLQTPALAMAFAAKRQHLLHRVRRVLGVPTRPFVSNGSLAGLTLATILFMSVSVYAVQQQQPKPALKQPKPLHSTRKHKVDSKSEYGMVDDKRISYVIWKGQKLPATKVASLQRQLDLVMAGKLSLDTVKQPNRDILLTIIEKNNAFDSGMDVLGEGLSHIDYDNIVANAMNEVKGIDYKAIVADAMSEVKAMNYDSIVNSAMKEVKNLDYNRIVDDAMASVDTNIRTVKGDGFVQQNMVDMIQRQDSLLDLQEINKGKVALLKAKAQSQSFAVEAVERKIERLERQKSVLEQKRFFETNAQQQVISRSGFARTDSSHTASVKQLEAGEATIKKIETEIEALNQQIIDMQSELEKAEKPLREMKAQIRKLGYSDYLNWRTSIGPGAMSNIGASPAFVPRPAIAPSPPARIHGLAIPSPATPRPKIAPAPPAKPVPAPKPE